MACCGSQEGQNPRLHFLSLAKPAAPIRTNYWRSLSQQTEVRLSMYWGSAIERGRHGLKMEKDRQIGLAESQLFHYLSATHTHVSVHTHTHTQFPALCLAKDCKCWTQMKREGEKKEDGKKWNGEKIDWAAAPLIAFLTLVLEALSSVSAGILSILGCPLTILSFKLLSSIIFNNPWVNTGRNCSINNWREIYK